MSKRRYEGEQTKADILVKARTLFSEKGYAATSMDDICNATGRSIGNIYYYFKSKEDLFLCLVEQSIAELGEQWEKISYQCEFVTEKLYAYGDLCSGIERPLHSVEREFLSKVGTDSEAGQRFLAILNKSAENFKELIAEGIARGELKNEDLNDLTFIVSSFYLGLSRYSYFIKKDARKALFRKGTALLLHGISPGNKA